MSLMDTNRNTTTDTKDNNNNNTKLFYYTTCGWMMYNWHITALASGATLLLYDGSPFLTTNPTILFDYCQEEKCTIFGTSARYLDTLRGTDLSKPLTKTHDLSNLRMIASTGSPLVPENYDFVYEKVKPDVNLVSMSGGTDIVSCFVLGSPVLPVRRGVIACAGLGMDVDVFDSDSKDDSKSLGAGRKGELVCKSPFPSVPTGFWGDDNADTMFRRAYFERFGNGDTWCQGDLVEKIKHEDDNGKSSSGGDGYIIYGRSDTTLNPGGVRIGTAEIYRQVQKIKEVRESVVVGQQWEGNERIVLFVCLRDNDDGDDNVAMLDDTLRDRIKSVIRTNTSPRHTPAVILQVPDIPRTKSGKVTEIAVRDVIHGRVIKNTGALANPEVLDHFRDRKELGAAPTL